MSREYEDVRSSRNTMKTACLFLWVLLSCNLFAQSVAEENLVLHLNFDNNSLSDLSFNNQDVVNHQTSFADGCDNEGLQLAGIDNYLEVRYNSTLRLPDQVSMSFWYQHAEQDGSGFYSLVEQSANEFGGHSRYGTWVFDQDKVMACVEPDVCTGGRMLCQRCITSISSLEVGEWYHIVSTYDGASQKIYLNGQLDSEDTYTTTTGISVRAYPLTIGTDIYDDNPIFLKGVMDDIRLFNTSLTGDQIDSLFQPKVTTPTSDVVIDNDLTIFPNPAKSYICLLYTSDAADE